MFRSLIPNTVLLDDELLPGEVMYDAKVMHAPSAKFLYQIICPNPDCRHEFLQVTLQRGIHCPSCGLRDAHHKTYHRLVKAQESRVG